MSTDEASDSGPIPPIEMIEPGLDADLYLPARLTPLPLYEAVARGSIFQPAPSRPSMETPMTSKSEADPKDILPSEPPPPPPDAKEPAPETKRQKAGRVVGGVALAIIAGAAILAGILAR